jgi:hypothetical protein
MTNLLERAMAPTMPTAPPRSSRTRLVSRATKSPHIVLPRTWPKDRKQRARLSGIGFGLRPGFCPENDESWLVIIVDPSIGGRRLVGNSGWSVAGKC